MTPSAAFRMHTTRPHDGAPADSLPTSAPLPAQSHDDRHLADRVARALRATGYGPLRDVAVSVHARAIILGGRVPSYHLKQVAQAAALSVPGIDRVVNDLEVGRST